MKMRRGMRIGAEDSVGQAELDREARAGEDQRVQDGSKTSGGAAAKGVNGLAVLAAIVFVGLVSGAGFYRWKRAESDALLASELADAPHSREERLDLWLRYNGPQIHHRLAVVGRFTSEMPWLVTHAVVAPEGGAPEIWGVDCAFDEHRHRHDRPGRRHRAMLRRERAAAAASVEDRPLG